MSLESSKAAAVKLQSACDGISNRDARPLQRAFTRAGLADLRGVVAVLWSCCSLPQLLEASELNCANTAIERQLDPGVQHFSLIHS